MGLGVEYVAVMGLFCYGGWRLDEHYGHETPWLTIVGFVVSFTGMLVLTLKEAHRTEGQDRDRRDGPDGET